MSARPSAFRLGLMVLCIILAPPLLGVPHARQSEHAEVQDLKVARMPLRGTAVQAAASLRLRNTGEAPLRLISAASPLAKRVEFHRMSRSRGAQRSTRLPEGVTVPPGATVAFARGGLELRLSGWRLAPRHWAEVPLTLRFADGSELALSAPMRR
jgi:copper(I)-binding protein